MQAKVNISTAILQWISRTVQLDTLPPQISEYLAKWTNGEKEPTFNQVEKVSRATGIPLGYFFLQTPPHEDVPLMKYRTVSSLSFDRPSRNLIETIHDMEMVQDWTREHMIAEGSATSACIGIFKGNTDRVACAKAIRDLLKLRKDWFVASSTVDDSFRFIRNVISNNGVLVMMNGIVGNNTHRPLDIEEFRAFAMVDEYAPLIFINTNDSGNGRLFSLLHEFAHVCVGENDFFNDRNSTATSVRPVEVLCNAVAAEILVPQDVFLQQWDEYIESNTAKDTVEILAKYFKCGITVIARKALDNNKIESALYHEIAALAVNRYTDKRRRDKGNGTLGGNYYRTAASRIDRRFFRMLVDSIAEGKTLYTDAFRLTNTNRSTFARLVESQIGGVQ